MPPSLAERLKLFQPARALEQNGPLRDLNGCLRLPTRFLRSSLLEFVSRNRRGAARRKQDGYANRQNQERRLYPRNRSRGLFCDFSSAMDRVARLWFPRRKRFFRRC